MPEFDSLKLENQLCFPLYAASKELVRRYTPLLEKLDLTYTQYITMMVMWEKKELTIKELGEALYLDSGTLTPLLKKLESKGYVKRSRSTKDEREVIVSLSEKGSELREEAVKVPYEIGQCVKLTAEEAVQLYQLLYKVLGAFYDEPQQ